MQKIYAESEVPKGTYVCLCCGKEQVVTEKGILNPCPECEFPEFKATIVIELTRDELRKKLYESIKLLSIGCYLFEKKRIDEFLNVMAVNLKMLLCDGENSLLPMMNPDITFKRGKFSYDDKIIHPDDLFLFDDKLSLQDFLEQTVIRRDGSRPITISKIIRSVANKSGGLHVDTELSEDYYLAASVSKYYFIVMAKYVVKLAGYDYDTIISEFINNIK